MQRSNTKISREKFEKLTEHLQSLEQKVQTEFSTKEIVKQNEKLIRNAIENLGYTFEDIAKILADHDAKITQSTLKSYLRSSQKKSASAKKRKHAEQKEPGRTTQPESAAESAEQNTTQARSSSLVDVMPPPVVCAASERSR